MLLYDLARMSTATTGTGAITLGSAVSGFLSFSGAGVQDGDKVTYAIRDGSNSEIGRGTYTASGTSLSRDKILASTNSGSAISLSGSAQVVITPSAEDLVPNGEVYWTPPTTSTFGTTRLSTGGVIANMSYSRGVRLTGTKTTTNVNATTYALIAVPTGGAHSGWIATARLRRHWGLATWGMAGMMIRDSVSGRSRRLQLGNDSVVGFNFNSYSSDDIFASVTAGLVYNDLDWWQRVWHDGTNINWQVSKDGDNWETIAVESPTLYLTNAPTHVGILINPNFGGAPSGANPFSMDCLSWAAAAY